MSTRVRKMRLGNDDRTPRKVPFAAAIIPLRKENGFSELTGHLLPRIVGGRSCFCFASFRCWRQLLSAVSIPGHSEFWRC